MTPFWFITIGLGVGWLINSGRLTAIIQSVLQLPQTPGSNTPPVDRGPCPPGTHFGPDPTNPTVHLCVADSQ